jgi:CMP-N,N'-diacetyllegionaminic acid synthase
MLLALVPARGGSKGIPRKNLALLAGKPLLQYTLEAALASRQIDDTLLSTDDEEIAAFAAHCGVATRYRRPSQLAVDDAPMMPAVEHALEWYARARGRTPDAVLLLQPTSPLRTAADIDGAIARFREVQAETLASVHRVSEHPCECVVSQGGTWRYLVQPPATAAGRQEYRGDFFFINGAVYLARTEVLLRERRFIVPGTTLLYEMPRERGIDIDSPPDLACAAALLGARS